MKQQKPDGVLELGTWLGRKQAFASLAGGCSAADAECLRQMRDQKQHRELSLSWAEFCKQRIGMSRQYADRLIGRLEEFGPQYFRLAQATGITVEEYRRIAGSIGEKGLAHAGELIPITAEDAPRLIAAVEELKRKVELEGAKREVEKMDAAIEKMDRLMSAAVTQIVRVKALPLNPAQSDKMHGKLIAHWKRLSLAKEPARRAA